MNRLLVPLIVTVAVVLAGCASETRVVAPETQSSKDSFTSQIQNNPNLPDAAKKAVLGKP